MRTTHGGALRPPERRAALIETMAGIEAFGWVAAEPPRNGAAEPHAWRVNPRVFERFAERAAAERERRDRIAAVIREFIAPKGSREGA
jgi:hypothetical protein